MLYYPYDILISNRMEEEVITPEVVAEEAPISTDETADTVEVEATEEVTE